MRKLFLPLLLFLLLPHFISAQRIYEYSRLRIGIDVGFENTFGSNVKPSAIRESQSFYQFGNYYYNDYYYGCGYMYNEPAFTRYHFTIKPEYSLNNHVAVAAGLRFSFGESSLTSDRDNFLWKIHETETSSNYLRIKSINQTVYGVGLPLEMKIYPGKSDIFWRLYGKVGLVFNFAFASDISVDFANEAMNKYLPEVRNQFEKPDFFDGQFVFGFGMKIGRSKYPFGNLEFQVPIHFNSKQRLSSLFEANDAAAVGLQTTIFIPVGKKKLSYKY